MSDHLHALVISLVPKLLERGQLATCNLGWVLYTWKPSSRHAIYTVPDWKGSYVALYPTLLF